MSDNIKTIKNSCEKQRKFLEKNLDKVNTIVGALLGIKTNLTIKESKSSGGIYFDYVDEKNIKDYCGVMANAFERVYITTFTVSFDGDELNNRVYLTFDFRYDHINGGSNGANFLKMEIVNDVIRIL